MSKEVFSLQGAQELEKLFKAFPDSVVKRAKKTGLRKAGSRMRTLIRGDARKFKRTGRLVKSLKLKVHKNGSVSVGLKERFYYKTLDMKFRSGGNYRPWFAASVSRHARTIVPIMIRETQLALTVEAGKAYARNKSSLRRR